MLRLLSPVLLLVAVFGVVLVTQPGEQAGAAGEDQAGQWGPIQDWPIVAVHSIGMRNGKVLAFDAWEPDTYARVYDPATGGFTTISAAGAGLFCSSHNVLADGRVLVSGGHSAAERGIKNSYIFDPATSQWTRAGDMAYPRWYPSSVRLADGRVLIVSGNIQTGVWADTPEVFNPATGTWSTVGVSTADIHDGQYPPIYLLPNGKAFVMGPDQQVSRYLDVSAPSWTDTGLGATPLRNPSTAMYRPGKVIMTGGGEHWSWATADQRSYVVDLTTATPAWRQVAAMTYPRYMHSLVPLPDGKVLAIGGTADVAITSANATLPAEIWDPATEAWTVAAAMTHQRSYHSTHLLMPDGRVLSAGGGRLDPAPTFLSAQYYSPPYLFKGARPVISSATSQVPLGGSIAIQTPGAAGIASVALVNYPSFSHKLDFDQHYVPLTFTAGSGNLTAQVPANGNVVPPGFYMLFIIDGNGVPSVAAQVQVGGSGGGGGGGPALLAGQTQTLANVDYNTSGTAQAFQVTATASGNADRISVFVDGSNAASQVAVGLYAQSGGAPGALLSAGVLQNPSAGAWNTVSVPPAAMTAGQQYWLAILGPAGGGLAKFRSSWTGSGMSQVSTGTSLTGLPASWTPNGSFGPLEASIYVSASGGGADTTPPTALLSAPAEGSTVSGTVSVTANASDNVGVASVQFSLDGAPLGAPDTSAPYSVSWDTTTAANAQHTLTARASDAAGNTGSSTPVTVTVNNAPPPAGVLLGSQVIEPVADYNNAGTAQAFQVTAASTGTLTSLSVYVDGGKAAQMVVGLYAEAAGSPSTLLATGTITNPAAGAWNTVNVAPAPVVTAGTKYWIAILGPAGDGLARFRSSWSGAGMSQVSVGTTLTSLPASWTPNGNFGPMTVSAYGSSGGGGGDTTAPTISITAPAGGATVSGAVSVTASASDNTGVASVQFYLDGTPLGAPDTSPPYSVSWETTTATNAQHTLTAQASDAAGNTGTAAAVAVMVDNSAPPPPPPQQQQLLLGSNTIHPSPESKPAGQAQAFQFTAAASGSVSKLWLYVAGGTTSTKVVLGLYSASGNNPGALLASGTINGPVANAWNAASIAPVTVTAGQQYWIALLSPRKGGAIYYRVLQGAGGASQISANNRLTGLPGTWSATANVGPLTIAAYAEGTPSSSAFAPASMSRSSLMFAGGDGGNRQGVTWTKGTFVVQPASPNAFLCAQNVPQDRLVKPGNARPGDPPKNNPSDAAREVAGGPG